MTTFYKKIGKRIKEIRSNLGLSQVEMAAKLKIKRVTLSTIENGTRKLSTEELFNLARFFNISADVLLDFKKPVEIVLQPTTTTNTKESFRISIPQNNVKKFKETLLYILEKVGAKENVGETVLYKLLYFIDFDYYEMFEEQLIGAKYQKNTYGPTPVAFKKIVDNMIENDALEIVISQYFKYPQRKYLPKRRADLSVLKATELAVIDKVLDQLSDMSATKISEYSHGDVPWIVTEDNEIIDYESVFYRTKPYSARSYDDD